jgi:hypothetical protein
MFLNWLFANRISRRPVATWEDCVGPASLRATGLQSRGNVGICARMRCGCRINSAGRTGGIRFRVGPGISVSLEASDRSLPQQSADSSSGRGPQPRAAKVSPPRYGQSAPLFAAVHESAIGPNAKCGRALNVSACRGGPEVIGRTVNRRDYPKVTSRSAIRQRQEPASRYRLRCAMA